MAETLCNLGGSGGGSLKDLGFVNVPSGTWVFKSTKNGNTWPGFSSKVIPLTMQRGASASGSSLGGITGNVYDSKVNNVNYVYLNTSKGSSNGQVGMNSSATNDYAFLPYAYNMDLTSVQNNITSGTITCWLEKK